MQLNMRSTIQNIAVCNISASTLLEPHLSLSFLYLQGGCFFHYRILYLMWCVCFGPPLPSLPKIIQPLKLTKLLCFKLVSYS